MTTLPLKWLCIAAALTVSGCQSSSSLLEDYAGKIRDQMQTQIGNDGTKVFVYTLKITEPSSNHEYIKPTSRKEALIMANNAKELRDLVTEQTELGLEKTLEMTQYCREGYIELNRLITSDRGEIRGECNESATTADREQYSR
ncbi:MAG: hypothetical protein ACRCT7_15860 [Shewanella sp.]|uniref:hypothetical protein n=1 Tax=Shewanella sp. SNU WT4 TaxID=2590015 RepID=UPI001128D90E|nr:hypothetical protein [Shewanella sp. SNU WT4]QDF67360.1 hypothetical protein FJQ87_12280 [Shewanella sp. SNU WT4]